MKLQQLTRSFFSVLFALFILISSLLLPAQTVNDVALRGLRTVHQNSFINPSWLPDTNLFGEYRASKGFHFGGDIRSNYLVINDLLSALNHNNDIKILKLLAKPKSIFSYTGITATLGTGYTSMRPLSRSRNMFVTFGYQFKTQMALNLNGLELGVFQDATIIDIDKQIFQAMSWLDFSVGIAGSYKAFDYGIRAKYLVGLFYAGAYVNAKATIREDSVHAEMKNSYLGYGFVGGNRYSPLSPAGHGVAFDIGLTFRLSKQTTLDLSINDLGFIGWNQNIPAKVVADQQVNIGYLRGNNFNLDNVGNQFLTANNLHRLELNVTDTAVNSIRPLYSQFSLGFKHIFNGNFHIGGVYHHLSAPAAFKYAVSFYGTYRFLRYFEFTLNTGLREGSISALGLGFAYTGKKFQAFITTENIIALLDTYASKNFHILFGFNFRVGSQSLKLVGPVDRVLCADPIIDDSLDEEAISKNRKGLRNFFDKSKKGSRYAKKHPDGLIDNGISNKAKKGIYSNSYSEIISKNGKEGGAFNKVDYIAEKLADRELPEYNPKAVEIQKQNKKILLNGRSGGFYNEKYNIELPKKAKTKRPKKERKKSFDSDYGQSGRKTNRLSSQSKSNRKRTPRINKKNKNRGLNYGKKGNKKYYY